MVTFKWIHFKNYNARNSSNPTKIWLVPDSKALRWTYCVDNNEFYSTTVQNQIKKKQLSQEDIPEQMTIVAYPCSVLQLKFNPLVRIESWK